MKRIINHWTAGGHTPSGLDLSHYHEVIDGKGVPHKGKYPVTSNQPPLVKGAYAAHTLNANSDSIGIAVACMAGAKERPFNAGKAPMTQAQYATLVQRNAHYCALYGIPVSRETVLTHAEVERTLGIKQKGKWDITVWPGGSKVLDPIDAGDILREDVRKALKVAAVKPAVKISWLDKFLEILFGWKK